MLKWPAEDPHPYRAFRLLRNCQKLKSLSVEIPFTQRPGFAALREVRGLERVIIRHPQDQRGATEHVQPYLNYHRYLSWSDKIQALRKDCRCPDAMDLRAAMCRPRLEQRKPKADATDLFQNDPLELCQNQGARLTRAQAAKLRRG